MRTWPALIIILLLGGVTSSVLLAYLATCEPSVAIERDYYMKALHWDSTVQQQESAKNIIITPHLIFVKKGIILTTSLVENHIPIHGATVYAKASHVARGNDIFAGTLSEKTQGSYQGLLLAEQDTLQPYNTGLWDIHYLITQEQKTSSKTIRLDLSRKDR